jgi:hypothetical protein
MQSTTKTLIILTVTLLVALPLAAQRGDDADRVSKNGRTEGEIDGIGVVLEYGRPNVKEREIWDGLVPFGKVWRTGANEATTITLSADATIGGESLPAGTYSLFTIPGESEWTVIFNKVASQWGAFDYAAAEDALRITATPGECEHVEAMDFVIEDASVTMRWEKVAVSFDVTGSG